MCIKSDAPHHSFFYIDLIHVIPQCGFGIMYNLECIMGRRISGNNREKCRRGVLHMPASQVPSDKRPEGPVPGFRGAAMFLFMIEIIPLENKLPR